MQFSWIQIRNSCILEKKYKRNTRWGDAVAYVGIWTLYMATTVQREVFSIELNLCLSSLIQ